jgi:hypothetical protein
MRESNGPLRPAAVTRARTAAPTAERDQLLARQRRGLERRLVRLLRQAVLLPRTNVRGDEEATVPQKTPQKHAPKKVGKSLKEKREAKKAKKAAHKSLIS